MCFQIIDYKSLMHRSFQCTRLYFIIFCSVFFFVTLSGTQDKCRFQVQGECNGTISHSYSTVAGGFGV